MTTKELLSQMLEYTYEREGAYPPLTVVLAGLTAAQASWKPAPERRCIWQIVRHMSQWLEAGNDALAAHPRDFAALQRSDWSEVSGDEHAWQADLERLHRVYDQLKEWLHSMTEEDLSKMLEPYRGKPRYGVAFRFARTAMHVTYHLGQIRYLRALQGAQ